MENSQNNFLPLLTKPFIGVWLLLLVGLSAYLSVHGVSDYYYSQDEISDIFIAKAHDLKQVLDFSLYESHPPVGQVMRHYWLMISDDIWFARSLALIFGMGLIPIYYCIGNKLNGSFTGLCTASLVAFGHGFIVQSYVVRNYSMFLFFISLSFYCYLHWRENKSSRALLGYLGFAVIACLTHLSAIFTLFAIAAYEAVTLYIRKSPKNQLLHWIIANGIIGLIFLITNHLWHDVNAPFAFAALHEALKPDGKFTYADLLISGLFYPFIAFSYTSPIPQILYITAPALTFTAIQDRRFRAFLVLSAFGLGLGMLLVVTGAYQFLSSRRNLWIVPFIIPISGWAIGYCGTMLAQSFPKKLQVYGLPSLLAILIIAGLLSYNRVTRFSEAGYNFGDLSEYNRISENEWNEISDFMKTLDSKSLVVLDRYETFIIPGIENPYDLMNKDSLKIWATAVMPYYNTNILFPTSYYGGLGNILHIPSFQDKLKNADRLVFLNSETFYNTAKEFINCAALDKERAITFSNPETARNINYDQAQILIVSKQVFFDEFVSPSGKAHNCLIEK